MRHCMAVLLFLVLCAVAYPQTQEEINKARAEAKEKKALQTREQEEKNAQELKEYRDIPESVKQKVDDLLLDDFGGPEAGKYWGDELTVMVLLGKTTDYTYIPSMEDLKDRLTGDDKRDERIVADFKKQVDARKAWLAKQKDVPIERTGDPFIFINEKLEAYNLATGWRVSTGGLDRLPAYVTEKHGNPSRTIVVQTRIGKGKLFPCETYYIWEKEKGALILQQKNGGGEAPKWSLGSMKLGSPEYLKWLEKQPKVIEGVYQEYESGMGRVL